MALDQDPHRSIVALVSGCSLETSARAAAVEEACGAPLPAGTSIYITALPGDSVAAKVTAARRLRRAGFNPVPHVSARHSESAAQLEDLLTRLAGEAAVEQVLVIGGDADHPLGPFSSSLALLETGLFERHGIRRIGIAGYPEGHPKIAPAAVAAALGAKIDRLRQGGISPYVVTQFCFETAPILAWLARFRARGEGIPVRVGLAGPASVATLVKYAVRCGIGTSLRALRRGAFRARLLAETGPEPIIRDLALSGMAAEDVGLHFFTFGGIAKTSRWILALSQGDFEIPLDGKGLRIRS